MKGCYTSEGTGSTFVDERSGIKTSALQAFKP
jgi:hypothetical protein